jgi:hypothetical protein
MDAAIEAAVAARFPRPGEQPPEYRSSDHHVKKSLVNILAPLPDRASAARRARPSDDLPAALGRLRRAVDAEHRTGIALPATPNWFTTYGPRIRQQAAACAPHQAHSTGAVEAVNTWLTRALAQRARHLGNRQRMIKLLDLLTVGYNHHADERAFAVAIRKYLEGH